MAKEDVTQTPSERLTNVLNNLTVRAHRAPRRAASR